MCFSSSGSDHFNIRKINSSLLNGVVFFHPKLPLFFPPSLPCFFEHADVLIKYPFYYGSLSILLPSCSYLVILMKILTELQVRHSSLIFFSAVFKSSFGVDHILFPCFKYLLMPVHLIFIHFSLFNCSGLLKISRRFVFSTLHSFTIFRGCYLIQAI